MAAALDLNLLPSCRIKGQERASLPGLLAIAPPRRCARGRESDQLLIYLGLSGTIPFYTAEYNLVTTQIIQRFYHSSGALTSALRTAAESANQILLERNLKSSGKGQYLVGRLILGVLRGGQIFFAQSGPTHVFHLTSSGTRQIHEEQIAGRGLGFSQTTPLHFSQLDLSPGDLLVLSTDLPSEWEAALSAEKAVPALDILRRRLMALRVDDLSAVLAQVQVGKGSLNLLSAAPSASAQPGPAVLRPAAPEPPAHPAGSASEGGLEAAPGQPVDGSSGQPSTAPEPVGKPAVPLAPGGAPATAGQPSVKPRPRPAPTAYSPASVRPLSGRFVTPRLAGENIPEISRPAPQRRQQVFRGLAKTMRGLRVFFSRLSERIRIFLPTLLPSLREEETSMANSSMAFIAIAIPVLVVTVAVTFFNRYGSAQRYQENFNLAQSSAQEAVNQTDPADVRVSWERTIYYLDQAEQYKTTQQSEELRQEAQAALDGMDDIVRLDFAPTIIGGLPRGVQVSHMAATETDLYLLDSAHADIIRTYLTSQGYEIDTTFACASGAYGGTTVGPLVDMAILPKVNKYSATVLAMDASGNMLYCGPSETPVAASLAAPSLGLHAIAAFAIDSDGENLYILDPQGNSVWSYSGSYSAFTDLPIEYFADQVPQDMGDAIDMTINSSDLYLLFRDGHVTNCTESSVAPTACNDPVTFIDDRPEHHSGPQISDAVFGQMTFAAPPDQMLYLFEPNTQAVYQFVPGSNSLTLQDQFRASEDLDQTIADQNATAMAISPTRTLFMSVGSQVYSATLP